MAIALGYTSYEKAIRTHCKGVSILDTPSARGLQPTKYIKEADIYRLVMRSKLPEAEAFQDWVCEEVLPCIRKNGAYMTDDVQARAIDDPDFLMKLAKALKKQKRFENRKESSRNNLLKSRIFPTVQAMSSKFLHVPT